MNEHYFRYTIPDLPRTTTRKQYKGISRFLRSCRREVEKKIDPESLVRNYIIYGHIGLFYAGD
jgi:hypothetical protein